MDAPVRVLAVDNEPSVTLSMRFVFSDPRFEVTCVDSGDAALARLASSPDPYDAIIVDEKMPGLTGLELVAAIRHRGIHGKIIAVSAQLTAETRAAYQRMGVDTMMDKPFNVADLRAAVERLAR